MEREYIIIIVSCFVALYAMGLLARIILDSLLYKYPSLLAKEKFVKVWLNLNKIF